MNRKHFTALALAIAALGTGHAMAADSTVAKTREQVKAELAEAIRSGSLLMSQGI